MWSDIRARAVRVVLRWLVSAGVLGELKRQLRSYSIRENVWDKPERLSDTVNVG